MRKPSLSERPLWRRLRDRLALEALRALSRGVAALPLSFLHRLGDWLGALAAAVPSQRRRRVEKHLRIAFPGEPEIFLRQTTRESFQSTVKMGLEMMWLKSWRPERDNARVTIEDRETFEKIIAAAKERGRGLALMISHLGSTEILMPWFISTTGMDLVAVAGRSKMEGMSEEMARQREAGGCRILFRGEAGLGAVRHLKSGGVLAMLVDHNIAEPGVEIPFLGQPAHTAIGPAKLALSTGAVCATMFAIRDTRQPGKFFVRCADPYPDFDFPKGRDARFEVEAQLAVEYTRRIEAAVRQSPGQYLWMHKRWVKRSETLPFPSSSS